MNQRVKLFKRLAEGFGYDLIKRQRNHDTLESHLRNLFDLLQVNCVIDVGANEGQFGVTLRHLGYRGRIVSFEPVGSTFEILAAKCEADPDWLAHRCALGDRNGRMTINVPKGSLLSSFLKPSNYGLDRSDWASVAYTETVEVKCLDDVFEGLVAGIENPRVYLKLDTQGFDLKVVQGGRRSLDAIRGMQSEISMIPIYDGMPDHVQALSRFRDLGFVVTGFYPVARDRKNLAVIEFDCVLRRAE